MSKPDWTPGPWRVEEDTALVWGECVDGLEGSYGMGVPVAEAKSSNDRRWGREFKPGEQFANAHLIAAAPALYEALHRLYERVADIPHGDLSNSVHCALADAFDALAKARGEPVTGDNLPVSPSWE